MDQKTHISVGGNVGGHVISGNHNTVGETGKPATPAVEKTAATRPERSHRSIVCLDIEKFSSATRTDAARHAARAGLYRAQEAALGKLGIGPESYYQEDRGDGGLILVDPSVPKELLVTRFPYELAAGLAEHNAVSAESARVRLRVVMHAGEVGFDDHGAVGDALNFAFRILDAQNLKDFLADAPGEVVLAVSEQIYQDVVRHTPAAGPDAFRKLAVAVRDIRATAWARPFGAGA